MEKETNTAAEVQASAQTPSKNAHKSSAHHHRHGSSHHHHHHHSSSHHSSSKHSSHSGKKKKKKSQSKTYTVWRSIFSFMLFLCLSATAVLTCMRITVLNETRASQVFTNSDYLAALHGDVLEFSNDLCLRYGIPGSSVNKTVTYDNISDIQTAYTLGQLDMDEMYTPSTYMDIIEDLNASLVDETKKTVKENGIEIADSHKNDAVKNFANEITDYITKKVEFKYISDLQSIFNISSSVLTAGIILFAILSVAFLLLTISFAEKEYRSFRAVSFSVFGAAGLNLLLVVLVGIVSIFKDLLIYPYYFCESVMSYINSCVSTFLISSIILFIFGTMVSAMVWRLKRNNE